MVFGAWRAGDVSFGEGLSNPARGWAGGPDALGQIPTEPSEAQTALGLRPRCGSLEVEENRSTV